MSMRSSTATVLIAAAAVLGLAAGANAQSAAETARQFAPSGKLRVGVLMLSYFAVEQNGQIEGWSPDIGIELARRLGVPHELVPIRNPADMIDAFKGGKIDVTFIGITKDRAAAFDFGPVMIGLRTTFLVPASSAIKSIPEIDQAGVRIVVPARSAQGEHLEKIIKNATMLRVPVETTKPATDLIARARPMRSATSSRCWPTRRPHCRDRAFCPAAITMCRSPSAIRRARRRRWSNTPRPLSPI
jgi:polar amino acid transport system substrate-binding protein